VRDFLFVVTLAITQGAMKIHNGDNHYPHFLSTAP